MPGLVTEKTKEKGKKANWIFFSLFLWALLIRVLALLGTKQQKL